MNLCVADDGVGALFTEEDEAVDSFAFYAVSDKAGLRRAIRQVLPEVQE